MSGAAPGIYPVGDRALLAGRRGLFSGPRRRLARPSDLPNLAAWYRFNLGLTVTGAGVSQWDDQSGNARHLLQGTDANRPPKQADGSILFDGVAQFLRTGAFTLNQPLTHYILVKSITWTDSDRIIASVGATGCTLIQGGVSPQLYINAGATLGPNGDLAVGSYGAVCALYDGTSSLYGVNRNAPLAGNGGPDAAGGITLGAQFDNTLFANIQVKELVTFADRHSAGVRSQMLNYLLSI